MATGRPDYYSRSSPAKAVLGVDEEYWNDRFAGSIVASGFSSDSTLAVPNNQAILLTYLTISLNLPGINYYMLYCEGVLVQDGYFDQFIQVSVGGDIGYLIDAGYTINVKITNLDSVTITYRVALIGILQNL